MTDKKQRRRRLPPAELKALVDLWVSEGRPAISKFARRHGMDPSTASRSLLVYARDLGVDPGGVAPQEKLVFPRDVQKAATYVVTSAQNATPVHPQFLAALKKYCQHHKAELIIIPYRYHNATSLWTEHNEGDEWWAPEVVPHLCTTRHRLGRHLDVLADVSTQPTATNPLSGMEAVSGQESILIGHPKIALTTIPAASYATPKVVASTGTVTLRNYTDSKAGKKGEFHHSFGAAVVELDGDGFHLRHIIATEDGNFIDLDTEYTPRGARRAPPALALVMGDVHAQFADEEVMQATLLRKGCLADVIKPQHIVWHDVLDFYSGNHHHRGKPFLQLAKQQSGLNEVEREIRYTFKLIEECMARHPKAKAVFPRSNHDAALYRWMQETDWRSDPVNAVFYLETALHLARNTKMTANGSETPDPFAFWGQRLLTNPERYVFLSSRDSFVLHNVDVGSHGHEGPNGARGHLRAFARLGAKTIVGHSHTPGIYEGAVQVGTSSKLALEYNTGPSSWMHSHGLLYANGKRTLVHIINGKFTNRR